MSACGTHRACDNGSLRGHVESNIAPVRQLTPTYCTVGALPLVDVTVGSVPPPSATCSPEAGAVSANLAIKSTTKTSVSVTDEGVRRARREAVPLDLGLNYKIAGRPGVQNLNIRRATKFTHRDNTSPGGGKARDRGIPGGESSWPQPAFDRRIDPPSGALLSGQSARVDRSRACRHGTPGEPTRAK